MQNEVFIPTDTKIISVWFDSEEQSMFVELNDERVVQIPFWWYPAIQKATLLQRYNFSINPDGYGVRWPDLDEDLSIKGFLGGTENY